MTSKLVVFDKLYRGISERYESHWDRDKGTYIRVGDSTKVGFLVPFEGNSNDTKRCATVDKWADSGSTEVVENLPMKGVTIVDYSTRYATDNKVVQILTPGDIVYEVYIPNLVALLKNTTVINGVIQEELIWGRVGANNYLIVNNGPEHKEYLEHIKSLGGTKPKSTTTKYNAGDTIVDANNTEWLYLGRPAFEAHGNSWQMSAAIATDTNYGFFSPIRQRIYDIAPVSNEKIDIAAGNYHIYLVQDQRGGIELHIMPSKKAARGIVTSPKLVYDPAMLKAEYSNFLSEVFTNEMATDIILEYHNFIGYISSNYDHFPRTRAAAKLQKVVLKG